MALAIGTPLTVLALARLPCKLVLLTPTALLQGENLLSALSTDYPWLLAGRIITAPAQASFFAMGATAASLAPMGQASKAIAVMFAGLALVEYIDENIDHAHWIFFGYVIGQTLPQQRH